MLSRSKRLNLKKDFKWVVQGKVVDTKYAKLFLRMGDNIFPKVGIATSSKSFKKSTDRNRARRIISAAIEPLYDRLHRSLNIVSLPKTGILSVKSGDVLLDLEAAFVKQKVIDNEREV